MNKCPEDQALQYSTLMRSLREKMGISLKEAARLARNITGDGIKGEWIHQQVEKPTSQPLSNLVRIRALCEVYKADWPSVLLIFASKEDKAKSPAVVSRDFFYHT